MILRNLVPQAAQARVADASGPQQVSVGTLMEFKPVAWAYAHRIEDVGGRVTWHFDVILRSMTYSLRVC